MLRPAVVMCLLIPAANLFAQTTASGGDSQSRTAVITASFTKCNDVSKTRHGITKSKYRRVESEPAVKANPADYSGTYEVPKGTTLFGFGTLGKPVEIAGMTIDKFFYERSR